MLREELQLRQIQLDADPQAIEAHRWHQEQEGARNASAERVLYLQRLNEQEYAERMRRYDAARMRRRLSCGDSYSAADARPAL
jgi:hypothetical protein